MTSAMTGTKKVSCSVRIPAEKKATAVRLFAEEQVKTCCLFTKTLSTPIMDVKLDNGRRHKISDTHFEYLDCRVKVSFEKITELHPDCSVKLKVKRGELTLRKKLVNANHLIEYLQSDVFGNVHVAFDVSSFYPLTVSLDIQTKKTADETLTAVVEASNESVQCVSDRITDKLPLPVPVESLESLMKENTTEAQTDEEWEDISSSDHDEDEGEVNQDDGHEVEKYPVQEDEDISCFKGLGVNEEQEKMPSDEATPGPVRRNVWAGMWRPVRRVALFSVWCVFALTALLVVLEPMLPGLDDDEF